MTFLLWIFRSLFVLSALGIPASDTQGIYITVIEVNHDRQAGGGDIMIKSFSDDLTNALRSMNFNIPADGNPCDELDSLKDYLETHLQLQINEEIIDWSLVECTVENGTNWIHLSYATDITRLRTIEVETDWMTELFGNQQNIIKVKVDEARVNGRLSKAQTHISFEF